MLTHEENESLCRVGRDTPMGKVMRRYWHPIATSDQLPRPDCDPLRVTLLGEKLVVFRDSEGKVGVLEETCMHRGASLALGRVEGGGIRCLYHGWKFAVDGTILETPNNPDPRFRERLKQPCFPVREEGGLIWTVVGAARKNVPPFRRFSFMDAPEENRIAIRINVKCNYLQLWEGGADSSHVGILHADNAQPGWMSDAPERDDDAGNPANLAVVDNAPTFEIENTDYGFHYAAMRRTKDAQGNMAVANIRVVPLIMPTARIIPAPNAFYHVFETPDDDGSTSTFIVIHGYAKPDKLRALKLLALDDPRFYDPETGDLKVSWANSFGQDRELQRHEHWSGLGGVEREDATVALSMGPLFDRTKEHLVAADGAVVRLRRRLQDCIKLVEAGEEPLGATMEDLTGISVTSDAPLDRPWQAVGHHYEIPPQAAE
jgi:Phenylpropionate dioxygenase and related ring-hydroxylating dioxygenases, large terminal subunit